MDVLSPTGYRRHLHPWAQRLAFGRGLWDHEAELLRYLCPHARVRLLDVGALQAGLP